MLVSYKLLRELVDLPQHVTLEDVINKLTFSGLEVEGVKKLAIASKITVGQIIELSDHPESDHLHILKVDCGTHGVLQIVCGAPNVKKGMFVIVALVGAKLGKDNVLIKKSVIAGYESMGMCCSLLELGVDEETLTLAQKSGIEELPSDAKPGDDEVLSLLGLDDVVLELNVLANRPDFLSVLGVAKELAALFDVKLKLAAPESIKVDSAIEVGSITENSKAFSLLEVKVDGKIKKSPAKLVHYLTALGYRSINLGVDLGNFFMALTGQPFHFYDMEKIKNLGPTKFLVRDDFEGELETLDQRMISVTKGDLVVTNGTTPVCLAGVMGLANVATSDESTHFGIEAAHFNYVQVRHLVNRTGLASDSSTRFIKKVNPLLIEESLFLLAAAYKSIDPSFTIISYSAYKDFKFVQTEIDFDPRHINHRLGSSFSKEEMEDVCRRLRIMKVGDKLLTPIDRPDLQEEADIAEEIFRFNDPSLLKATLEGLPSTLGKRKKHQIFTKKLRDLLLDTGLNEALTYTLIDQEMDQFCRLFNTDIAAIKIANPMTKDHEFVRVDLSSSLIKSINFNKDHQKDDFGLFEVSDVDTTAGQRKLLGIALTGLCKTRGLLEARPYDFYDLKGYVFSVLSLYGLEMNRCKICPSNSEFLHPGRSMDIFVGKDKLASLGEISPLFSKNRILIGEVDLSLLLEIKTSPTKFSKISVYPTVTRDFAFVVSESVSSSTLILTIKKAVGSSLKNIDIFDIFALEGGKRSIAIKVTFSSDHTFNDEELRNLSSKVIDEVFKELGGVLR